MFVENQRGSSMQLGRMDAQVSGRSPGVIVATIDQFQSCQKKASKSSTNTKSDVTGYKTVAPRGGTYTSRKGINVKILLHIWVSAQDLWETSCRWRRTCANMLRLPQAGSERGERRRGEDERWKEERALQQQSLQTWRLCEERCDILGLQHFLIGADVLQCHNACSLVLHTLVPIIWHANLFIHFLSVSLSVSITDRETDKRPCFCLLGTPAVKPAKQEKNDCNITLCVIA